MPAPTLPRKNIWVAAGDGDLELVKIWIEQHGLSANVPDPYSYTPMHAAASYGHTEILTYLLENGGDINITDSDGDTPLYTVESVEVARFLVDHGAKIDHRNNESISPIEHLEEDFPDVAQFLVTLAPITHLTAPAPPLPDYDSPRPSEYSQNERSEELTTNLLTSIRQLALRTEAEGRDPNDEELREAVGRAVIEGMTAGVALNSEGQSRDRDTTRGGVDSDREEKRPRLDDE